MYGPAAEIHWESEGWSPHTGDHPVASVAIEGE